MKFTVGYQLPSGGASLVDTVREFREHLSEVFFAWPEVPSGRAPLAAEAREQLEADLRTLRQMGLRLNLLFNASCYGPGAFSRDLADSVAAIVEQVDRLVGLDSVTTMSPMIARLVKSRFPRVAIRASVNMRLGTVAAMEYVADLFDGFTMQREYNRDLVRLAEIKAWCDRRGKHLHLLANSGCLAWCAVQTFHDNLVSHEAEVDADGCMADTIPGSCWEHYGRRDRWVRFLRNTWIRPEDVRHYESFGVEMKLATRMHARLRRVVRAYAEGRYVGNLADLLEPGQASLFAPWVFDNRRFPADWFDRVTSPSTTEAEKDAYARQVLDQVLVDTGGRRERDSINMEDKA